MRHDHLIVIGTLNGRNGADPPLALPDDQAVEMLNVDRWDGLIGRKRGGTSSVTDTGGTAFSSGMQSLFRHVPGADETAAEFWGIDGAGTPIVKRMTGGSSFANVTLDDAISTRPQDVVAASLNGKLFLAYDSTQDRLHAYDPALSSPRVRRVGIAPGSSAPTAANSGGAGVYAAVLRYYRVRFVQWSGTGTNVVRRSEATPSVSFTPDGAHANVTVTRPTAPGEGETHWEVEVSPDNSTWYMAYGVDATGGGAAIAIATTTQVDSIVVANYGALTIAPAAGAYGLFPSVKYLITDGNRLLGAGSWEPSGTTSGGKTSRVWYTPVLGSTDDADDERVPNQTNQKNWVDLNENDGGGITGLGGPLGGIIFAFKYRQIVRLVPTSDVATPYLPKKWVDGIGCVSHKSIAVGIDESGRPALYFQAHLGAFRIVMNGTTPILQYLWRDNEDLSMNLGAATVVSHSVYYPAKHQWWLWIATGSSDDPDTLLVFDPILAGPDQAGRLRKGWFKWTGNLAAARCSTLMSNTLGATMSRDLKPYIGRASGTAIQKADTGTDDAGTAFQAYVKSKPLAAAPLGTNAGLSDVQVLAKVATGVTLTLTVDRDYGIETRTSTVDLSAGASETRTLKKFEGSALAGAGTIQAQLGDGSAASNAWVLDALAIPVLQQERR